MQTTKLYSVIRSLVSVYEDSNQAVKWDDVVVALSEQYPRLNPDFCRYTVQNFMNAFGY